MTRPAVSSPPMDDQPARSEHLDAIRSDLTRLLEHARWAHGIAYEKPGRGLDAERGAIHRPPTPEELAARQANPDAVAGPVHDIEHGDHDARVAYQHAVRAIARTNVYLAGILRAEGTRTQPAIQALHPNTTPTQLAAVTRAATWRVDRIHGHRHHRRLKELRTLLDTAVRRFSPVLDAGAADGIAHAEKPCRNCKIRPMAMREKSDGSKRPAAAGECDVCATWRRRNGQTRPANKLDHGPVNEARAAQARRRARGEDFGAA